MALEWCPWIGQAFRHRPGIPVLLALGELRKAQLQALWSMAALWPPIPGSRALNQGWAGQACAPDWTKQVLQGATRMSVG